MANMLEELGFEKESAPGKMQKGKQKGKRKGKSSSGVLWQQPYSLELLHLDRAALKVVADRSALGKAPSVPNGAFTVHAISILRLKKYCPYLFCYGSVCD